MIVRLLLYLQVLFFVATVFITCANNNERKNEQVNKKTESVSAPESSSMQSTDFQMSLWQKGIDFYARGNEPSWSLDMDFEKHFQFKTMNGFEMNVPTVEEDKAMGANVTRYRARVESGEIIITIQEQKCNDTMSDQLFWFSVKVEVKSSDEEEFWEYTGCGNYVPDYALHDIWVLGKVNGKDATSEIKVNQLPRFEFFAKEGKVLGYTGCNEFKGKYHHTGIQEIQFSEMVMNKKSCPDAETENLLNQKVFGRRMKYSKEKTNLILTGYDDTELIFKKVD